MVHKFVRTRGEFEFERIRANSNLHPYLPCPLPCARPLLGCWLPPVSFAALSLFTLSSTLRWLALLPGMHFFPASALVCVSVFLLACFLGPGSRVLFFLSC